MALKGLNACVHFQESYDGPKHNVVIKPKAHAIALTRELAELYPDMKHIYLYRHPAPYVRSVQSVFNSLLHPVVQTAMMRLSIKNDMQGFVMTHFPDEGSKRARHIIDVMSRIDMDKNAFRFACLFVGNVLSAQEQREKDGIVFKVQQKWLCTVRRF